MHNARSRAPRRLRRATFLGVPVLAVPVLGVALLGVTVLAPAGAAAGASDPSASPSWLPRAVGVVKNLDIGARGRLVYAESSPTGVRVVSIGRGGRERVLATLPARPGLEGDTPIAAQNDRGQTWVVFSPVEGAPVSVLPNVYSISHGRAVPVLNTAEYQAHDPDPYNLADAPDESNPYDVEVLPDGSALITDAANNDLLRVWRGGHARTVACFPSELVATSSIPFPWDGPAAIPAEAVPTGVVARSHHRALVSELKGFPFPVGGSQVWSVRVDRINQGCSGTPASPVAPGRIVAGNLTAAVDVTTGPRGRVFVTELNTHGVFAAEQAFADPSSQQGQGGLVRLGTSGPTEVAAGRLSFPGSTAIGPHGSIVVVNNYLFGGVIERVN